MSLVSPLQRLYFPYSIFFTLNLVSKRLYSHITSRFSILTKILEIHCFVRVLDCLKNDDFSVIIFHLEISVLIIHLEVRVDLVA